MFVVEDGVATMLFLTPFEPPHSRGAPDVPEPLTLGAQYLTRYSTWKKIVRAARPAPVNARPKPNIGVRCSSFV